MQAAVIAARRGHQVVLYESASELGGQLVVAKLPPHKGEIASLIDFMARKTNEAGVEIKLNTKVTPEIISKEKPDAVVVAAGGTPCIPDMPGVDLPHVCVAQSVLSGQPAGKEIVIIGGGMVGCETAHFLSGEQACITVIEMQKRIAGDMSPMVRKRLMDGLREKNVNTMKNTTCMEILSNGIRVKTDGGEEKEIQADTVILAVGYQANDTLYKEIKDCSEIFNIGDSAKPQRIREAILAGYRTGLSL